MKIVWDEPKRLANLDKHGLDFADLNEPFFDTALGHAVAQFPQALGRDRRQYPGRHVVVFAGLGTEGVSIVRMRPASRNERKLYAER
jgi:uncharacterized protein